MKDLFQVVTLEEAQRIISTKATFPRQNRKVSLEEAFGQRTADIITALEPVPAFNRSTVDGYAVQAADTFGSSDGLPALLNIIGTVEMGRAPDVTITKGNTAAIATGGMIPVGADAVVMTEYTEKLDENSLEITRPVAPGENVILQGEDIPSGSIIIQRGTKIGPFELGILAATGCHQVPVAVPLKVGIISTGEEIVPPHYLPKPGEIRDINSYCLAGLVRQSGGESKLYGIVKDHKELLAETLAQAVEENDMVIISGGSSVGARDITLDVLDKGLLFHGVAIRPGKPTLAAIIDSKLVIGLPGHPASAAIAFYLLVKPLLEHGNYQKLTSPLWATLTRNIASGPGREDYVRVKLMEVDGVSHAVPILGKSGLISTLTGADGLIKIPLHKEGLLTGEQVEVFLL